MTCLVVHGHFYQPPREEPTTGEIPPEEGADPYANFNEKITAECYMPNAALGNFHRMSFDVGPTLVSWLARHAPRTWKRIASSGGGLAQSYHHTILPLASRREKELQIAWGRAEFEHRFGRRPRGLWLPETAADAETLTVAAEQGFELTVLAPWQAAVAHLDPFEPYWVELAGGRRIAVFFYHGALSGRLSFDPGISINADAFATHLLAPLRRFAERRHGRRGIVLLATDGELYGHHQRHREHFLRHLMRHAAPEAGFTVTTLESYLDEHPPGRTIGLAEPTSWSCHHGVARWAGDCPCSRESGWKAPLRALLVRVAAAVDEVWEREAAAWFEEPGVVLERSVEVVLGALPLARLAAQTARRRLSRQQLTGLRHLIEAQWLRHRMFASCAWFHGQWDRLELRNNLAAARAALARAESVTGAPPAPWFEAELAALAPASERQALSA